MRAPRLYPAYLLAVPLLVAVWLLAPQQLGVILYKCALVVLAGIAGYLLDRWAYPYGRPHLAPRGATPDAPGAEGRGLDCWAWLYIAATLRRALIIAAAMLAVGLGL
ncbi:MAG: putative holin [Desulfobulbaceae bacterium]